MHQQDRPFIAGRGLVDWQQLGNSEILAANGLAINHDLVRDVL